MKLSVRSRARECALMVLYSMDVAGHEAGVALERFWGSMADGIPLDPPPAYADPTLQKAAFQVTRVPEEMTAYAEVLALGVAENLRSIDDAIQGVSRHWRIDRMSLVDRNLLRLGAFELLYRSDDVPRNVVINEAVELAKRFGAAEARAFVNGILDRLGRRT